VTGGASSYDQVPYTNLAFAQTHPDHLATTGRLFGLTPPDVSRCRVLELGCGRGGNLIPMAFNLADGEFVGIDYSAQQVADARATIRVLGIPNVRIEAASIMEVDRSWGTFDYIICHGVFSWVEPDVQDRILQIAGDQLNPGGLAYVSYNTYPGWHMRQMVRDMMRYHAAQFSDAEEQVAQARALLSFVASAAQSGGPYGQLLAAEAERAGRASDTYLFHEHLEQTNIPLYFHQFIDRAERARLQYLSEAIVSEMLTTHFPRTVAETLERISPDILHLEQYMDFVRNRQFRQTLLCRDSEHPRRALSPAVLDGLLVSSSAVPDVPDLDLAESVVVAFRHGTQRADVRKPAAKAALAALAEAWPRAIPVDALCDIAIDRAAPHLGGTSAEQAREAMLEDLFGAVMYGLVTMHTVQPPCTNDLSDRPRAYAIAALQAQSGAVVVNTHHRMIELDAVSRAVLVLSDGSRDQAAIIAGLVEALDAGRLKLEDDGTDYAAGGETLAARGQAALRTLVRNALLVE
jgi:methyltransferase-like protein/trans-aconitate methyltransferase